MTIDEYPRQRTGGRAGRQAARARTHIAREPFLTRTLAPLVMLARKLGDGWAPLADQLRGDLIAGLGDGPLTIEMPAWLGIASA